MIEWARSNVKCSIEKPWRLRLRFSYLSRDKKPSALRDIFISPLIVSVASFRIEDCHFVEINCKIASAIYTAQFSIRVFIFKKKIEKYASFGFLYILFLYSDQSTFGDQCERRKNAFLLFLEVTAFFGGRFYCIARSITQYHMHLCIYIRVNLTFIVFFWWN